MISVVTWRGGVQCREGRPASCRIWPLLNFYASIIFALSILSFLPMLIYNQQGQQCCQSFPYHAFDMMVIGTIISRYRDHWENLWAFPNSSSLPPPPGILGWVNNSKEIIYSASLAFPSANCPWLAHVLCQCFVPNFLQRLLKSVQRLSDWLP